MTKRKSWDLHEDWHIALCIEDDATRLEVRASAKHPDCVYVYKFIKGEHPLPQPLLLVEPRAYKTAFFSTPQEALNACTLLVPEKYRWL